MKGLGWTTLVIGALTVSWAVAISGDGISKASLILALSGSALVIIGITFLIGARRQVPGRFTHWPWITAILVYAIPTVWACILSAETEMVGFNSLGVAIFYTPVIIIELVLCLLYFVSFQRHKDALQPASKDESK